MNEQHQYVPQSKLHQLITDASFIANVTPAPNSPTCPQAQSGGDGVPTPTKQYFIDIERERQNCAERGLNREHFR
jgi:hypothetical protein